MSFKVLIIIPTYIEEANISILIPRLFNNLENVDVLVVDDNSSDQTCKKIQKFQEKYSNLHLIMRTKKMGVASAYIEGYKWGLAREYKYLGQMDADLSHRVRDLKNLIFIVENHQDVSLVIGSRWVLNGGTENWPMKRSLLSKLGNKYIRFMFSLKVHDTTAGFRIYSSQVLSEIDFSTLKSQGFSFQIEMLRKIMQLNGEIREIPIIFRERQYGRSKITLGIIVEAFLYVTKAGLRNQLNKLIR
jgi:dolichol-phosphate mannosyltransferase